MKIVCLFLWVIFFPVEGDQEVYKFTRDQGDNDPTNTLNIFEHVTLLSLIDVYPSRQVFKFKINACDSVLVFLSTSPVGDYRHPFYAIRIDEDPVNGTHVDLYYIHEGRYTYQIFNDFPDEPFLDCFLFRKFWISWKGGHITVGKGYEESKDQVATTVFSRGEEIIDITSIGIMTNKGSNGQWMVVRKVPRDPKYCQADTTYAQEPILSSMYALSSTHCAAACFKNVTCFGFNHNIQSYVCQMIPKPTSSISVQTDDDWMLYVRC